MSRPAPENPPERQPRWFLILFALAAAGGAVGYVPLLTVLLPQRIADLQGGEDVAALAQVTFLGAVMASLANIVVGWLSDRSRVRRPWIAAGLIASNVLLIAVGEARSVSELIVLVMVWQVALNLMLSPLMAWAGDCFPDCQKGVLGGALALAPALGALAGSLVTYAGLVDPGARLGLVAVIVSVLVMPALVLGGGRVRPALMAPAFASLDPLHIRDRVVLRMWIARLLVQVAEGGMFAFLLFWLRSLAPGYPENGAANIFSAVLVCAVPASLIAGRWSDRHSRPVAPLISAAVMCATGMLIMAAAQTLDFAIAGYVMFAIAAAIFLALHSSQTLRVLPAPQHRGRDLGLFNLTNTVPGMVMPWLTVLLVPSFGFGALFVLFACLSLASAALLAGFARRV
ncbi:MFS transporter [Porphyrobacter sp. HT-58-2]|uniref:MFS transporter n=1 Tax=Porphyrobacter sp. HT-58-2 TaxID=2023229 RepID=UPI000CDC0602|nr:MFS transporter [Porphyrobacter sp. HT-58-2]AUX70284.1 MFS transporter [Porphyrobacter sp. HT-58-2]